MLRQAKQPEIENIWLEEKTWVTARFVVDIRRAIKRFAAWQGAESAAILNAPDLLNDQCPAPGTPG